MSSSYRFVAVWSRRLACGAGTAAAHRQRYAILGPGFVRRLLERWTSSRSVEMINVLAVMLLVFGPLGCKKEVPLPEIPASESEGTIEVIEAARPEGGTSGTFAVSDMTRPPSQGDIGWWPSVAVSSEGVVHVTYTDAYNGAVHHAERAADGEWSISVIDSYGAVGKYTALAISKDGTPHVVYYNQDSRILRHAMRAGNEDADPEDRRRPRRGHDDWTFEVVDQGFEIGMAGRLLVDRAGTIHALYYGPNQRLVHAYRPVPEPGAKGRWHRRTVDADAAGSHSIVLGFVEASDGTLHATYSNWLVSRSELRYGRLAREAENWKVWPVDGAENAGWKSGIVLDEHDEPVIAYLVLQKRQIWIARLKGKTFEHEPLVGDANTMDFARAPDGSLIIAYEHLPGRGLGDARVRFLWRKDSRGDLKEGWQAFDVPSGFMSTYLSLAASPSGRPVVAYYRGDIRGVSIFDARASEDAE